MTAASGADQPTLRDQLAEALHEWTAINYSNYERRKMADALLPLIEADRERAVANALAARVLRDIDYAVERDGST